VPDQGDTTYPTEWCRVFNKEDERFVLLHLKEDDLRMYGRLDEWPNYPDKGHFVVMDPEWLDANNQSTKLEGVRKILIPVTDVGKVEFMKDVEELCPSGKRAKRSHG
jgi:hypothetical protein